MDPDLAWSKVPDSKRKKKEIYRSRKFLCWDYSFLRLYVPWTMYPHIYYPFPDE